MGFTSAAVHPDNVVTTMSGGEKQGVAITRALYFDAELVILDEPTMGLSPDRDPQDARFRRQHQEGRQVGYLHRSQYLPRLSRWSTGSTCSTAARSRACSTRPTSRWTTSSTGSTAWPGPARWSRRGWRLKAANARPSDNRAAPPSILRRYGSQLGIIGVGLAMWLAFVVAAPRGLHRYRHLSRLRPDDAAVRHHRAVADLRGHHRRDRSLLSLGHGARHGGLRSRHHPARICHGTWRWSWRSPPARSAAGSTARWWRGSTFRRWSSLSARSSCSAGSSWC